MTQSTSPLELADHPLVRRAAVDAIERGGCNSPASQEDQDRLKAWLCKKTGKKNCFLYGSSRVAVLDLIQHLSLTYEITITDLKSLESFQQWAVNFGRMKIRLFRDAANLQRILDEHDPERLSEYVCVLDSSAMDYSILELATSRVKTAVDASCLTKNPSPSGYIVLNFASLSLAGIGSVCFNDDLILLESMKKRHSSGGWIRSHELAAALACTSMLDEA